MKTMFARFKKYISERGLIREGERVVLAISGGVDSMVLLDMVSRLAKSWGLDVVTAHVNYRLRDQDSMGDEELVREAARQYGVHCEVLRQKPPAGTNLQNTARKIRHDFLKRVAKERDATAIATAHHRGDQAETVLLHLLRGSGLKGLAGISPVANLGQARLVRPLLHFSRAKIESYAKSRGVLFREDITNATTIYKRNAVRHRLIPLLREFNPRIEEHLARLAGLLSEDEEALNLLAHASLAQALRGVGQDALYLDRGPYIQLPAALRRRVLRMAFEQVSGRTADLNSDQLFRMDQISLSPGPTGTYRLPAPWKFSRQGEVLSISRSQSSCDRPG